MPKSELDQTKDVRDREWKIEDAARTLERSEEIRADKKLFDAAKKELQRRNKVLSKAISTLGGLK